MHDVRVRLTITFSYLLSSVMMSGEDDGSSTFLFIDLLIYSIFSSH